jgi:hypothetical protein
MLASHCAECVLTGRLAMLVFQMLSAGNVGQPAAPGSGVPADALVALEIDAALMSEQASSAVPESVRTTPAELTILSPSSTCTFHDLRTMPPQWVYTNPDWTRMEVARRSRNGPEQ